MGSGKGLGVGRLLWTGISFSPGEGTGDSLRITTSYAHYKRTPENSANYDDSAERFEWVKTTLIRFCEKDILVPRVFPAVNPRWRLNIEGSPGTRRPESVCARKQIGCAQENSAVKAEDDEFQRTFNSHS